VLALKAGDETYLGFGAQISSDAETEVETAGGTSRSALLGIVGGLFLLLGVGLAVFGTRLLRGR
jgi:hypothetical protein